MRSAVASVLVSNIILVAGLAPLPVRIPFNTLNESTALDAEGIWPSIPIYYGPNKTRLDCYPSLWEYSVFVAPQICSANLSCTHGFRLPRFYIDDDQDRFTDGQDGFNNGKDTRNTSFNWYGLRNQWWNREPQDPNTLSTIYRFQGDGYLTEVNISTTNNDHGPGYPIIGLNVTTSTSDNATILPLLSSSISIRLESEYLNTQSLDNGTFYQSFGMHLGSTDPWMPGSLYYGGFDSNRILGNLANISIDEMQLTNLSIGVEEGFLPLERLVAHNGSFYRGPYSFDIFSIADLEYTLQGPNMEVAVEPGLPHFYLPETTCDALANILNLKFDTARNVYLWQYSEDHAIFNSPTYLGFNISGGLNVKVPFRLLQPVYQAAIEAADGTLLPPVRYFPCSPSTHPLALGRAFLQAAFIGAYQDSSSSTHYFLAQAPGPHNDNENVLAYLTDGSFPTLNISNDPNEWTRSWSTELPIWTVNTDGTLLTATTNTTGLSRGVEAGIGVGSSIGLVLFVVACFYISKSTIKHKRKWQEINRQIAEENEEARNIERQQLEKQRLEQMQVQSAPHRRTSTEEQEVVQQSFQIPRKPVASGRRAKDPLVSHVETDALLEGA